jgi:hypothetical protein
MKPSWDGIGGRIGGSADADCAGGGTGGLARTAAARAVDSLGGKATAASSRGPDLADAGMKGEGRPESSAMRGGPAEWTGVVGRAESFGGIALFGEGSPGMVVGRRLVRGGMGGGTRFIAEGAYLRARGEAAGDAGMRGCGDAGMRGCGDAGMRGWVVRGDAFTRRKRALVSFA